MPIAKLEFNLPEEQEDFKIANNAGAYYSILWDISQFVRNLDKYDDRKKINKDEIVKNLRDLLSDYYHLES